MERWGGRRVRETWVKRRESIAERKWRENVGSLRVQSYCSHYLCNSPSSDVPQKLGVFFLIWVHVCACVCVFACVCLCE